MIPASVLRQTFASLGYKASNVVVNYNFAAVDTDGAPVRTANAAVFFEDPPSYRNAAIGVIEVPAGADAASTLNERRSLGAPFFIAVGSEGLSAWVLARDGLQQVGTAARDRWDEFVSEHGSRWSAQAVRRAKAIQVRAAEPQQQLLFDPAIVYTIQHQVQLALSELLERFLSEFHTSTRSELSLAQHYRTLFPLVFRLLAAKILLDRNDRRVADLDVENVKQVIEFVSGLYGLPLLSIDWSRAVVAQLQRGWRVLLDGLYVRNIAADDLAFVYENALITTEIRRHFGTHSTPTAVAEYVVRSLALPQDTALQDLRVYEPFAGSCVFLTAAMRRFKEALPADWSAAVQHRHLVSHFSASELDQFACEIARLSLILADYPNANGWHIHNEDLFDGVALKRRLQQADIVLCNPPFEDFEPSSPYRDHTASVHKPIEVLHRILDDAPSFLGIVMPAGFESHRKYQALLERTLRLYGDVELLMLPENTFRRASVGAVVVIAQRPRANDSSGDAVLRKTTVKSAAAFSLTLQPTSVEVVQVETSSAAPAVHLLDPLRHIWEELASLPTLGEFATVHRGLEWKENQAQASSSQPGKGKKSGLHTNRGALHQYRVLHTTYLDIRQEALRGNAHRLAWGQPKVICNAIRLSRGPWRLAAAVDESGLLASQQFFGIWLKNGESEMLLSVLAAVLNGPVANAFSHTRDPGKGLRKMVMEQIPVPKELATSELARLVREYRSRTSIDGPLFGATSSQLNDLLLSIDAALLAAYDLPPLLEKRLLKYMGSHGRPCGHPFGAYPGVDGPGAIPLGKRLALRTLHVPVDTSPWARVLAPLPSDLADVFDGA